MARFRVGVISDTHGLLRPALLQSMDGCQRIIHAGDIGDPGILPALNKIAPVTAVRGNIDHEPWCMRLPKTQAIEFGDALVYVLHDLTTLDLDPRAAGISAIIYGHSHHPSILEQGGILYLNPGSAGPRRFKLPVSLAILTIDDGQVSAELIELNETFKLSL